MSLATYDLFTDDEYEVYTQIIKLFKLIEEEEEKESADPTVKADYISDKKACQEQLTSLIIKHDGEPRVVRIKSVIDSSQFRDDNGEVRWPEGITWRTLRSNKRIAEFVSAESRGLGLSHMDITFDKIIVHWKNLDILRQIVLDGFILPIDWDGQIEYRKFRFMTASAGQLRTDKIQCISDDAWSRISSYMLCGLTWDDINAKGGINVNKLLAYIALGTSATDAWDISIDRFIVINDFEAPVTGVVDYIDNDYKMERKLATTIINHCDGIGMMLPKVSRENFMIRGPWLQWSLCTVMCLINVVNR